MLQFHKGFNSKGFLIIYLVLIGCLLLVWAGRFPVFRHDNRTIPSDLKPYLASPPRDIPQFLLYQNKKQVLTNDFFFGKWTFVYFSYGHCLPVCKPVYGLLSQLKSHFANPDIQMLVIGIDSKHESAKHLASFVGKHLADAVSATGKQDMIDKLAHVFPALYLITNTGDGKHYQIEQEHDIFLVDPKGRVYAVFKPPLSLDKIESVFVASRRFYAETE